MKHSPSSIESPSHQRHEQRKDAGAHQAVWSVAKSDPGQTTEDIKCCARMEKIPGGESKGLCALSSTLESRESWTGPEYSRPKRSESRLCEKIVRFKPDLVFTEKGVSNLAQHFLVKANIAALGRVCKSDNNPIARAVGATIEGRWESGVVAGCGFYIIERIGDEYFSFLVGCESSKACTILLRGPSQRHSHQDRL
jgi:hypothetical protein